MAWLARLKPAAPARVHLGLAAFLWSVVGIGLIAVGARWTLAARASALPVLAATAVIAGAIKALVVMAPAARRTTARIRARGDGRCLGGFLSPGSWALVVTMAVGGRLLRSSGVPPAVYGPLYLAVGVALAAGSVMLWREVVAARAGSGAEGGGGDG